MGLWLTVGQQWGGPARTADARPNPEEGGPVRLRRRRTLPAAAASRSFAGCLWVERGAVAWAWSDVTVLLEADPRVFGEADVGVSAFDTVALFDDRDWQAAEKLCFAGFVCRFGILARFPQNVREEVELAVTLIHIHFIK